MSVDILGTNWPMVQSCFTSTETIRLIRTGSPERPPRLSHSSWTPRLQWSAKAVEMLSLKGPATITSMAKYMKTTTKVCQGKLDWHRHKLLFFNSENGKVVVWRNITLFIRKTNKKSKPIIHPQRYKMSVYRYHDYTVCAFSFTHVQHL